MARLASLLLALGICLGPGAARSAGADLRSDTRLARPVTIHEPMITVRRLLSRLSAESGETLEAEPELGEETVCLSVSARPCGETLQQLAEALRYRWSARSSGYRLTEDAGARIRRGTLARQYRRDTSRELVVQLDLLDRFLPKFNGREPRDVKDELERMDAAVNGLPTGLQRFQAELELSAAKDVADAQQRPFLLALRSLPQSARERLVDGERLVMAAHRPGALPMPEEVRLALREARLAQERENNGPKAVAAQTEDEAIDFVSEVSFGQLTFYLRARWLPGQQQRLSFAVPTFLQTPSLVAHGPDSTDHRPGHVTADRPELLATPVSFTWPAKKLQPDQPLTYHTGVLVSEVLNRLADSNPRWHVAGDSIFKGIQSVRSGSGEATRVETAGMLLSRLSEQSRTGSLSLGDLLEPLAERGGVDLHIAADGWIRCRSALYFQERGRYIDPELLEQLFGGIVDGKSLTPEIGMAVGGRLTRAQVAQLSTEYLGFPRHLTQNSGLRSVVDAWRLLDRLSSSPRGALFSGEPLPYASLREPDRRAVREYLQAVSLRPNGAPLDLELGPGDLPALQLVLAPDTGTSRKLELRLGRTEPPIYTADLEAKWTAVPAQQNRDR